MIEEHVSCDVVIIGAGLTGLYLAYLLRNSELDVKIIEARGRIGGRIFTSYNGENAPIEMGATWLGLKHAKLVSLLEELSLEVFDQKIGDKAIYEAISTSPHYLVNLPPNPEPSMRIRGGSFQLIQGLFQLLNEENIYKAEQVKSIFMHKSGLSVSTNNRTFETGRVVSTLPPNLLMSTVETIPSLPPSLISIAKTTHTWMGESIKIALAYKRPFWNDDNLSGTIFSNVGPVPEMYDHSNYEQSFYALKGFLNGNYFTLNKAKRRDLVLNQLAKYYGDQVHNFESYEEVVWKKEPFTYCEHESHVLPHQHNGHEIYNNRFLNDRLIVAGSETSKRFPGYMEGAVHSALDAYHKLII